MRTHIPDPEKRLRLQKKLTEFTKAANRLLPWCSSKKALLAALDPSEGHLEAIISALSPKVAALGLPLDKQASLIDFPLRAYTDALRAFAEQINSEGQELLSLLKHDPQEGFYFTTKDKLSYLDKEAVFELSEAQAKAYQVAFDYCEALNGATSDLSLLGIRGLSIAQFTDNRTGKFAPNVSRIKLIVR
jgi:hypothetical protein